MISKIIKDPKFWKSVVSLGSAFIVLFIVLFWGVNGFKASFFTNRDPLSFIIVCLGSGLVYGFFVTYGKFWAKYKRDQQ